MLKTHENDYVKNFNSNRSPKVEKNVATYENCFLRKMSFKFQNLSFNTVQNSILERNKALNSKEKVKLRFLCICILYLMCMFPESNETKF